MRRIDVQRRQGTCRHRHTCIVDVHRAVEDGAHAPHPWASVGEDNWCGWVVGSRHSTSKVSRVHPCVWCQQSYRQLGEQGQGEVRCTAPELGLGSELGSSTLEDGCHVPTRAASGSAPLQGQAVGVVRVKLLGKSDVAGEVTERKGPKDACQHRVTPERVPRTLTWARRTPGSTQPGPAPPSRGRNPRPPRSDLRRQWMQAQTLAASPMRATR